MLLIKFDFLFTDNGQLWKYESDWNFSETIVDHKFDVTGLDYQDHTVMNVRKTRGRTPKRYCEDYTDPESITKKKPVKINKPQRKVFSKKNLQQKYVCPQCARAYFYVCSLRRHLEFECGKDYNYACPYCGRKSKRLDDVYQHIKNRHKGRSVYANELN